MSVAIKIENLSKAYQIGEISTGTVSRDIERWWAKKRGKEDPFLKIGEANDRSTKGKSDVVWSLRDVNFEIEQGAAVGIIGRNGAGKSTLLKLLSRVTAPTSGIIKAKGRIASLLEVGTGFHPDLTGRENIFLNGAILGMRKKEIEKKFDEIVDFAGIERYIDTPVKRYSSGMYVRLAFAVAAHLDSEILIVDEVLAVGDAEFQKKCLGKMGQVSVGEGRTVLFVSHNLNSIATLCTSGIILQNGELALKGEISEVISRYNSERTNGHSKRIKKISEGKKAWLCDVLIAETKTGSEFIEANDAIFITVEVEASIELENVYIGFGINDVYGYRIFTLFSKFFNKKYSLKKGLNNITCTLNSMPLKPGNYNVEIFIGNDFETFDYYDSGLQFEILTPADYQFLLPDQSQGSVLVKQEWQ